MAYDHVAQKALNQEALDNPQPGDYWNEMLCPYFLVVQVKGNDITVLSCLGGHKNYRPDEKNARIDNGDGTWSFDPDKYMVVDREWIRNTVKYKNHDGFVADVVRSEKFQDIVNEWVAYRAKQLLKEFKDLGPEASKYLLQRT